MSFSQEQNWVLSYCDTITPYSSPISGGIILNFQNNQGKYTEFDNNFIMFYSSSASVSSPTGRLLCYTNGITLMNATNDTMINGKDLAICLLCYKKKKSIEKSINLGFANPLKHYFQQC